MKDITIFNTDTRTFSMSGDITPETIGNVTHNILSVLSSDTAQDEKEKNYKREPIRLFISSYGGDVYAAWGLIDVILQSKTPIYTYCVGYVMSAGLMIFLAGHKRYAFSHSTFMYHQMSCWEYGKYQDLVENRVENDFINQELERYMISRTKFTTEDIKYNREHKIDLYFHGNEALTVGIATDMIESSGEQTFDNK